MDNDCDDIEVEQSCVVVKSFVLKGAKFQYQSLACEKCNLLESNAIYDGGEQNFTLDLVPLGTTWTVVNTENTTLCKQRQMYFEDGARYELSIFNNASCSLTQASIGYSVYTPLLVALVIYMLLGVSYIGFRYLYRKKVWNRLINSKGSLDELASYSSSSYIEENKREKKKRLHSLDTVRGISIVIMIFVNYGGGRYWFFEHSVWNGLTVADLVFPWFIWMMGMSLALSLRSLLRKAVPRKTIFYKIVKRSCILFILGLMINTLAKDDIDLKHIRLSGVLQRFSISYFVVATVHMFFARPEETEEDSRYPLFQDIIIYWGEWIVMLIVLVSHFLFTFLLHVPGCPNGYLGPGGMHDGGIYSSCTGGAANYIDRLVLGTDHVYQHSKIQSLYGATMPHDPEGILGYLTSIFLVYLGLQAGKILLTYQSAKLRMCRWLIWSIVTGALAVILSEIADVPVNKNLWSVSFIFATGSLAFLLMFICYFIIDVKEWWSGAPFVYAGMNSILLYVGHEVTHHIFPWSWKVPNDHSSLLAKNLWGTSLWLLIAVWAYHIDFFVTV